MAGAQSIGTADYIVIGAGSAGCVIANRLSADPSKQVAIIEAGGDDRPLRNLPKFFSNLNISIPAGFANLLNDEKVNWNYSTAPDPGTGGRVHAYPRGKVLGGSSAINGLMYVRGFPSDFDGWRQLGCEGWSWDDVLPLFRRAEDTQRGENEWHGIGGPLRISDYPNRYRIIDAFIDAACEFGLPRTDNINAAVQEGICYTQQTTRNGVRASAAAAFLHPVEKRPNLRIVTDALVTRIIFEGKRAVAVEMRRGGRVERFEARGEIILSGGTINSPQLLELSGIGQGARLSGLGIATLVDSRDVGENLRDHLNVAVTARLHDGVESINQIGSGLPLIGQVAKYLFTRRGLLSGAAGVATGYLRSRPELDIPDVQVFATAGNVDHAATMRTGRTTLDTKPGFTCGGYTMRPQSTGSIHARSSDPGEHPLIEPNYLSAPSDQIDMISQVRALRSILRQPSLARLIKHELAPLEGVPDDDDAILAWARATSFTAYHQAGTCRMGGDEHSVVDPQLRVRGVEGLRIADASVIPTLISANTNATCIMVGEKLADLILGRAAGKAAA